MLKSVSCEHEKMALFPFKHVLADGKYRIFAVKKSNVSVEDTVRTGSKLTVQFGIGANHVSHAFRHTDKLGLSRSIVQSSVETHFKTVSSQVVVGKPFNQIINIGGQRIQYTAFKLSNDTFNIGRIHGVK